MTFETGLSRQDPPSLTERLQSLCDGDVLMAESALREVLPELHRIAVRSLCAEQQPPFSATELIHECWLRKMRQGRWQIASRQHFYAIAALAMRQVLIELARSRKAQRRGGAHTLLTVDQTPSSSGGIAEESDTLINLGILMEQLEKRNPDAARIVDMHYFAGFTMQEIVGISG